MNNKNNTKGIIIIMINLPQQGVVKTEIMYMKYLSPRLSHTSKMLTRDTLSISSVSVTVPYLYIVGTQACL